MTGTVFSDCSEVEHVEGLLHELVNESHPSQPIHDAEVMQALRLKTADALKANGLIVEEVDNRNQDTGSSNRGPLRTPESIADRLTRIRKKAADEYAKHIGMPKKARPPRLPEYIDHMITRHHLQAINQPNTLELALIELRGEVLRIRTARDLQEGGFLLLSRAMWRLAANEQMEAVYFRDVVGQGRPKGAISDTKKYLQKIIAENPDATAKDLYHKIAARDAESGENGCPWDEYSDGVLHGRNGKKMSLKTFENHMSDIKNPKTAAKKAPRNKTKNPG